MSLNRNSDLSGFFAPISYRNSGSGEPLELLELRLELVSDVDDTLIHRYRSHFPGIFDRRHIVETLVRSTLVVIDSPRFDLYPGFVNRFKPVHVQAFVPGVPSLPWTPR